MYLRTFTKCTLCVPAYPFAHIYTEVIHVQMSDHTETLGKTSHTTSHKRTQHIS